MRKAFNGRLNKVVVSKNDAGEYECKGLSEAGRTIRLLVPVSTYDKILKNIPSEMFGQLVRSLFEAKYEQVGEHAPDDLGVLDSLEVDGLFLDIRAKKRREAGGWAKSGR